MTYCWRVEVIFIITSKNNEKSEADTSHLTESDTNFPFGRVP